MSFIDIVFEDKAPKNHPPKLEFVEIEDENGASMRIGEWIKDARFICAIYNRIFITFSVVERDKTEWPKVCLHRQLRTVGL